MAYFYKDNLLKKLLISYLLITSYSYYYLPILYCLVILHTPIYNLFGSEAELIEDQIIVKYKDHCRSPLDENYVKEQVSILANQNEHSIICPNRALKVKIPKHF